MGCGWLQGYSSCSATYRFQGQSLILSCDITACAGSCWDKSERLSPQVISCFPCFSEAEDRVRTGQFGITPWLPCPQVTQWQPQTLLQATAQLPLPVFKVSWRCWRGRNESRNSWGEHKLWKMPVSFFQLTHRGLRLKINDFRAGIRSTRQGENMARQGSSNSVLMNARVHLRWAWQEPGRSTGLKSDFKQTSKKRKGWKMQIKSQWDRPWGTDKD